MEILRKVGLETTKANFQVILCRADQMDDNIEEAVKKTGVNLRVAQEAFR